MRKIEPAIFRPRLSDLVEDYYLFIIEELDRPTSASELLSGYRGLLARTLRFETADLSLAQQDEALAQAISYYENDLALVDWNSAVIYDRDYEDTVSVLELINVELLEARYIDQQCPNHGLTAPTKRSHSIASFVTNSRRESQCGLPKRPMRHAAEIPGPARFSTRSAISTSLAVSPGRT